MPFTYKYARPVLAVDCVVFGIPPIDELRDLRVILVKRGEPPFPGEWALPGGHFETHELLEAAARRELEEETGAKVSYLEQLYTFDTPDRDPRDRVISVAYYGLVRSNDHKLKGASDAIEAQWFSVKEIQEVYDRKGGFLAFDHRKIFDMALDRLRAKIRYAPIGFSLLPPTFSLGDLQRLYEIVLGKEIDKRNFRKRILKMGILAEVESDRLVKRGLLYRFDKKAYDKAVKDGFNFEV